MCCQNCSESIPGTPACPIVSETPYDNIQIPVASEALVSANVSASDIPVHAANHQQFWQTFWAASEIDLGPDFGVLEKFYYNMQYMLGSGSAASAMAPALWGPWITTDTPGWNGDYTLNYNFQAIYYGVFRYSGHVFR